MSHPGERGAPQRSLQAVLTFRPGSASRWGRVYLLAVTAIKTGKSRRRSAAIPLPDHHRPITQPNHRLRPHLNSCPSSLSRPCQQRKYRRRQRRDFHREEARCFSETAFGFLCLPSANFLARQAVPANSWRSGWRLHRRHTRTRKRNPAVFRPRAARIDGGARRPGETL